MASESNFRRSHYYKYGCNAMNLKIPTSRPLSFWTEEDIWQYIKLKKIKYSKIYDMGYNRTGCMFCMYGLQMENKNDTRFDKMRKTHPKIYNYCMDKLGLSMCIEWIEKNKTRTKK